MCLRSHSRSCTSDHPTTNKPQLRSDPSLKRRQGEIDHNDDMMYRDIFNMVDAALRAKRGGTTAETERNRGRAERAVMGSWVPLALS